MVRFLVFVLTVCSIGVLGCSKSDNSTTPSTTAPTYGMSAKLDGSGFESQTGAAIATLQKNGLLTIQGAVTVGAMKQIALSITNPKTATTYTIGTTTDASATVSLGLSTDLIYYAALSAGSGTITITRLSDTEIEGTFALSAVNLKGETLAVTEGKFAMKLTKL
jgi:Zn-dependent alcohol dehydrogenase